MKTFFSLLALTFLLASCTQNNVTEDDSLKQYFDAAGVTGTFGMFDNGQGHFTIYNLKRFRDSAYSPVATFDILLSLVGIQTGIVKDDSAVIMGSGLRQAFQDKGDSDRVVFKELANRIGKDTLKKWIDSLSYGNKDISSAVDTFWLDNHLVITADEQLGFVKRLYFDQLPFFARPQKVVRGMMLRESNSNYLLSYKTGAGVFKDGHVFAWVVGWVEENKHPYFFVLNVDAADAGKDLRSSGLNILKDVLKQMGFFQGKK